MQRQPEVVFHEVAEEAGARDLILGHIAKLERVFDRIIGCRVVVDMPHKRHEKGNLHQVKVEIAVPGHDIFVTREPADEHALEDQLIAIGDAFDTAERLLKKHVEKLRNEVKHHEASGPTLGRVVKIFTESGYGFLTGDDGTEVYFHRNAVEGDFESLEIGSEVRFVESLGDKGPQASVVHPQG